MSNNIDIRKSNNRSSLDFLIIIQLSETASEVYDQVTDWVIKESLNKINHPLIFEKDYLSDNEVIKKYSWRIVSNIYNCDFENEDDEIRNEIWYLVHLDVQPKILFEHEKDTDGLIIDNEDYEPELMNPKFILEHFTNEPDMVIGIGISGVSQKFMKELWFEICSEGDIIDGECQGLLTHPMWIKEINNNWITTSESSNKFGWDNYPPDNNMFPFPKLF